ncbi:pyridoxine 5'-phosphate synthase [Candidatus Poribacteria bacterium]|nr:pyridoxine 5'-phosphate synthase [Candidatus Poribacteria bacterium]MYB02215.1 pyridoxine 5'-phosphate synthase [Candidatus Poribacteria bacterium]
MTALSVNVNKVATLRNSRGGDIPDVLTAVDTCVAAGAQGITVHPREDQRHITPKDVTDIAERLKEINTEKRPTIEYNIEGDPRPDLIEMVRHTKPTQCTLVPVVAGEVTSHTVWDIRKDGDMLKPIIAALKDADIRVSLFSGTDIEQIARTSDTGADRIELYTAPYAMAETEAEIEREFALLETAAAKAVDLGLGVNAGHDLNLDNLPLMRKLSGLLEVSIGHHLMADALYIGMEAAVKAYRRALGQQVT